ncbi:hypothetical protein GOQ29_13830 [Clostridium sp. D2Q-14]|uniref:BtrH N-terminal domain-containing protein n=1 Tax=Anaeromonas gelatinilytica TaxID=2683194 RepID=UPI00193B4248|nr:BtrH N-terminal domain-containing protein [Anaeromonas gelatinilytica]MBS4536698.1 hypothetical protein [Anaeromonas gelatinilytica]
MEGKYLDVKINNQQALNCLASVFINVAEYYGTDYQGIYKGVWGFDYDVQSSNLIFHSMKVPLYVDTREILTKEHGLETIVEYDRMAEEAIEIIRKDLKEGNPVCVCLNACNCKWTIAYRRLRFMHNCLIIGDDTEKEVFYISDPFFNTELAELPYNEFLEGYYYDHRFKKKGEPQDINYHWKEDIRAALINNKESFDKIKQFGGFVLDSYKELADLDWKLYKAYEFTYFFRVYYYSRYNYIEFLQYITENTEADFYQEMRLLQTSKEYWGYVWRIIQKIVNISSYKKTESYAKEVNQYLSKISKIESEVWEKLSDKVNN